MFYNINMSIGDTIINAVGGCDAPLVVYITHTDQYARMMDLRTDVYLMSHVEFNLLTKSGIEWNSYLSPWQTDSLVKGVGPFAGHADTFLNELEIEVKDLISNSGLNPSVIYIAGYSLAGLFALYSLYKTNLFDGAACCSGSLWYPRFTDFVKKNELCKPPKRLYMSLGDAEASVKNPVFASVEDKTREVCEHYKSKGIDVKFEMNPGNHMTDIDERVAKGIASLLLGW